MVLPQNGVQIRAVDTALDVTPRCIVPVRFLRSFDGWIR